MIGYTAYNCKGFNAFYVMPNEPIKVKAEDDLLFFIATVPN